MPKLKYSVAIPVKDYTDALKKVQKFVKRGFFFVDDAEWNADKTFHHNCSYVVVHRNGMICIFNHSGYGKGVILSRVRDVEQHYVQD